MNYVDTIIGKVIGWVDAGISFILQYKDVFVWGFLAVMVSKMMKLKIEWKNS
jgi:hypothetical protein